MEAKGGGSGRPGRLFRSLRWRMAASHGAVLALIVLLLGATSYVLIARDIQQKATASVSAAAQDEADHLAETGDTDGPVPDNDVPSASAIRVAVFLPNGVIQGERGGTPPWLRPHAAPSVTVRAFGEAVRLVTIPVRSHGRLVATVVAGRSLAPEDRLLRRVRLLLVAAGVAAILASMAAGWVLAGRAARPIRRAYEAQASFAANASHELRTPLAFVRSGVEVLAEHDPELGEEVLREVGYLSGLTERLLTLARADSGRLPLTLRPLAVVPLCRRCVDRGARVLGVRAEIEADGSPMAEADPVALEAALDSLLENVARHGGGAATVSCRQRAAVVTVAVADHGRGLAPGERAAAFERFYRVDQARSREDGGAGLGLPLARSLVEAQRGRMRLEETPGGGLTAVIELMPASPG